VRSPSYAVGGDSSVAEELLGADQLENLERRIRTADEAWLTLAAELALYPHKARQAIEELCVQNIHINPLLLDGVRTVLDRLTSFFGASTSRKTHRRPFVQAKEQPSMILSSAKPPARTVNAEKAAVMVVIAQLAPDMDASKRLEIWDFYTAHKARSIFNDGKQKRP